MRKPYIGGNWKMNLNRTGSCDLARAVADGVNSLRGSVEAAIFPPFVYLLAVKSILRERTTFVKLGAQDVYPDADGAFTGEISVAMLKDCGVEVVLAGHSERRHVMGENDELVGRKVRAILEAGLECVLCCGETLEQRLKGETHAVNEQQVRAALAGVPGDHLAKLTIAYEPVWAIGTGKVATPNDAQAAHEKIRGLLNTLYGDMWASRIRIQYGGSLKAANAKSIFIESDVDGGLVGGSALKGDEFNAICKAAAEAKSQ